ncbi:hypothetical protein KEG38_39860 [Polyangium jinanense]|uniref:hypothetical protein n=1 Tax=Polyangium jinanense TaxID=2829994 RepID=UPI00234027AE|nr:hypothetical protein [Polyangium jinanense]MDC3960079.1 hypothetical protein [Polyangium jinanense]
MSRASLLLAFAPLAAAALLVAPDASATNYSLWIHGRNTGTATKAGTYTDFSYWGSSATAAGINKKAVNWDGKSHISEQNFRIRNALDCYCTGANWCYIAAHSAGDAQIGYALDKFGGSTRSIKNASPAADGTCGNAGGTQTGWNIKWVDVASGAGGGSELANIGAWAVSDALTDDLKTATMRALYDHNQTRGIWFDMFAGAKGTLYSATLAGQDDEAVGYHSTGGVSVTGGFCNAGDLFCDGTLTAGTAATSNGKQKWSYHNVALVDTSEQYNHYANGAWAGIIAPVRTDMVNFAK